MHLREAELGGDTTLADVPEVMELDDAPLASREGTQTRLDQDPLLPELEPSLGEGVP